MTSISPLSLSDAARLPIVSIRLVLAVSSLTLKDFFSTVVNGAASPIIFKNENLTLNLDNLNSELKNSELVKDVVKFLIQDKKRPICSPFSK